MQTPPDIIAITRVILEVTRGVVRAEEEPGGTYPTGGVAEPDFYTNDAFVRLIERAGLDRLATLILRILLAAETERSAYRALQRLAGDPTQAGVAVDALITVTEAMGGPSVDVLQALRPEAPLVERGLVQFCGDGKGPPLVRRLTLPPRVVDHLVTGDPPAMLDSPLILVEPAAEAASLCPVPARDDPEKAPAAVYLRRLFPELLRGEALWLTGAPGSGRKTLLAAIAAEHGCQLLTLAFEEAVRFSPATLVPMVWREVLLGDAVLCVCDAEPTLADGGEASESAVPVARPDATLAALYGWLRRAQLPVAFTSRQPPSLAEFERPPQVVRFGHATPADTLALWRKHLPDSEAVEEVATRFRLAPGRIVRAADASRRIAASQGQARTRHRDVAQAVSVSVAQQVAVLGTLVEDSQTWDDIVLQEETRDSVREMIARVRQRHRVLDEWGFRAKLSKGLGLAALFSGPPGTGKTMVASLIARDLGQELYQIDLSRVVSKWVGETEKNLARVFDAAEGANVLLLFDEADSLFSKRTEVKSANDRHSNAEVNYLLQRVERFEGICILTTNLEGSIDPAFKRRLAFRVIFPMPDESERAELWRRMMPKTVQLAPGVDYGKLAKKYELTGGNIRNAVLRAAYLAASEERAIDMEILERAVRLEYRDAGKLAAVGRIHSN